MTIAAPALRLDRSAVRSRLEARFSWSYPTLIALAGAATFVVISPAVGDLFAALARQSAVANGVGLTYWFSWFAGGASPGSYSVLTPFLSAAVGSAILGGIATVAITPLCWRLVRGTAHPVAATWLATIVAGLSLWSGRIPFAVGTALSIAVFLAVRAGRAVPAGVLAVVTVLASPVSGAFIGLGLIGALARPASSRRAAVSAVVGAGIALVGVAVAFGVPGPEPFAVHNAIPAALALIAFLLARPAQFVRWSIFVALAACPLMVIIPNGMGANLQRFVWVYLPVAVVATASRRLPAALLAVSIAVYAGAQGTADDLYIADQPSSSAATYQPLVSELDTMSALTDYRVEVVPDGTHVAAYALLGHAMLARGYETQADTAFNGVLMSPATLNAVSFKIWLDDNAVGYVAIGAKPVAVNAEYRLVTAGLPYLVPMWVDAGWTLYRVANATPIIASPARIIDATQSNLQISTPAAGTYPIRVRWSRYLRADPAVSNATGSTDGRGTVTRDGQGWTVLTVPAAGTYVLHG